MSKCLCLCLSLVLAIMIGCQGLQPAKTSEQAAKPDKSCDAAAKPCEKPAEKVADIILDNSDPEFKSEGYWDSSVAGRDHKDDSFWTYSNSQEANAKAVWTPDIKVAGTYEVFEWHGDDPNMDHAAKAPFTITCASGSKTVLVDQTKDIGKWNSLGSFKFAAGKSGNISVTNKADGNVLADAVKLVYKGK